MDVILPCTFCQNMTGPNTVLTFRMAVVSENDNHSTAMHSLAGTVIATVRKMETNVALDVLCKCTSGDQRICMMADPSNK